MLIKRFEEAERYLIESYLSIRATRGDDGFFTRRVLRRVIELYEAWGRPDEGAKYRALARDDSTDRDQPSNGA